MSAPDLVKLHVETAVKLSSVARVQTILDGYSSSSPSSSPTHSEAVKSTRGRRPGAAAAETRCQWNVNSDAQCKNNKKDGNSYCGMHLGKIHLIDEASSGASAPSSSSSSFF